MIVLIVIACLSFLFFALITPQLGGISKQKQNFDQQRYSLEAAVVWTLYRATRPAGEARQGIVQSWLLPNQSLPHLRIDTSWFWATVYDSTFQGQPLAVAGGRFNKTLWQAGLLIPTGMDLVGSIRSDKPLQQAPIDSMVSKLNTILATKSQTLSNELDSAWQTGAGTFIDHNISLNAAELANLGPIVRIQGDLRLTERGAGRLLTGQQIYVRGNVEVQGNWDLSGSTWRIKGSAVFGGNSRAQGIRIFADQLLLRDQLQWSKSELFASKMRIQDQVILSQRSVVACHGRDSLSQLELTDRVQLKGWLLGGRTCTSLIGPFVKTIAAGMSGGDFVLEGQWGGPLVLSRPRCGSDRGQYCLGGQIQRTLMGPTRAQPFALRFAEAFEPVIMEQNLETSSRVSGVSP